jgi:PKD repeat protein
MPGVYDSSTEPNPLSGTSDMTQVAPNATLLAQPIYGTAPLTVDFYVGLANPQGSLVYQWDFGDGSVSSLPASAYMPHVYAQPGTYQCSLTLMTTQGRSTTMLTAIIVLPRKS